MSQDSEYESLRQEIIERQTRRLTVITLAVTASSAILAASFSENFQNPLVPLTTLFIISTARLLLFEAHQGMRRIAIYLRIFHEKEGSDLYWEHANQYVKKNIHNEIQAFQVHDRLLFVLGIIACLIAIFFSYSTTRSAVLNVILGGNTISLDMGNPLITYALIILWILYWLFFWLERIRNIEEYNEEEERLIQEYFNKQGGMAKKDLPSET